MDVNQFIILLLSNLSTLEFVEDKRIWGIDFDNMRGWHLHPLENSEGHRRIGAKSIEEIIELLSQAWATI